MKKLGLVALLGIFVSSLSPAAFAATGTVGANMSALFVPISSTANTRFDVVNYDSNNGTCLRPPAAVQIYMLPSGAQGDKMRQVLLAAQLAGKKVIINWDDTKKDGSGYCIAQSVAVQT